MLMFDFLFLVAYTWIGLDRENFSHWPIVGLNLFLCISIAKWSHDVTNTVTPK